MLEQVIFAILIAAHLIAVHLALSFNRVNIFVVVFITFVDFAANLVINVARIKIAPRIRVTAPDRLYRIRIAKKLVIVIETVHPVNHFLKRHLFGIILIFAPIH